LRPGLAGPLELLCERLVAPGSGFEVLSNRGARLLRSVAMGLDGGHAAGLGGVLQFLVGNVKGGHARNSADTAAGTSIQCALR